MTEIPHGFSQGPGSPDEAVSPVMDDVLITASSTLDRWRRGEEENRKTERSLAPHLPKKKKKKKKKPPTLLHLYNVFHPFTLVTLIESRSSFPNVSALQKER